MKAVEDMNKLNVLNVLKAAQVQRMTGFGRDHSPHKIDSTCEPGRFLEANTHIQNYPHQLEKIKEYIENKNKNICFYETTEKGKNNTYNK